MFDFLVDLFRKLNIPEQNKCHTCGSDQRINYYDLNDTGILLCDNCFSQKDYKFNEIEKERISKEKNYLTRFLGAFIFSIPGIILWILFAIYFEILASGSAFIIAFLGVIGYDYFRGRYGKLKNYIIVFANIVSIIIANIMTVISLLVRQGLSVNHAIQEFKTSETARNFFYQNIIISFLLALIVWVWLLFIMKDKKVNIRLADKF